MSRLQREMLSYTPWSECRPQRSPARQRKIEFDLLSSGLLPGKGRERGTGAQRKERGTNRGADKDNMRLGNKECRDGKYYG